MKRSFRPVVTMLEDRQMLSSADLPLRGRIETTAKSNPHSIVGTIEGTFSYLAQPLGAPGDPQYYDMGFAVKGGQLNSVRMGGFGTIVDGVSRFYRIASALNLGENTPGGIGGMNANLKVDHLLVQVLDPPFSPTLTIPSSFDLRIRVQSANGTFRRDAHRVYSLSVVVSDLVISGTGEGPESGSEFGLAGAFTATFQS
jgi:hypothetical protein